MAVDSVVGDSRVAVDLQSSSAWLSLSLDVIGNIIRVLRGAKEKVRDRELESSWLTALLLTTRRPLLLASGFDRVVLSSTGRTWSGATTVLGTAWMSTPVLPSTSGMGEALITAANNATAMMENFMLMVDGEGFEDDEDR